MKFQTLAAFVLVITLMAIAAVPVSAHDYDRNDSDYPLRYVAYLVHPIGVALEYTITRPFHKLVHKPGWSYVMGHEVDHQVDLSDDESMEKEGLAPSASLTPASLTQSFEVTSEDGNVIYTVIDGPVLFASGSATLTENGKSVVDKIAKQINDKYAGGQVVVEGHTDSQPIEKSSWESNWELGAARAVTITEYMIKDHNFQPDKVAAKTYAQYKNAASNDTPEGRQANRRAVIIVTPPAE
jgi:flagellar motor protein MotB